MHHYVMHQGLGRIAGPQLQDYKSNYHSVVFHTGRDYTQNAPHNEEYSLHILLICEW